MTRGDMGLTERRRRLSVRGLLFVILGLLFVGALSVHATAGDPAAEVPLDGSESACSCKARSEGAAACTATKLS